MQGVENIGPAAALGRVFESLRVDNRFEVKQSFVKKFVDYNEVECVSLDHFLGGVLKPQFNDLGAVFAASLQPGDGGSRTYSCGSRPS